MAASNVRCRVNGCMRAVLYGSTMGVLKQRPVPYGYGSGVHYGYGKVLHGYGKSDSRKLGSALLRNHGGHCMLLTVPM